MCKGQLKKIGQKVWRQWLKPEKAKLIDTLHEVWLIKGGIISQKLYCTGFSIATRLIDRSFSVKQIPKGYKTRIVNVLMNEFYNPA